MKYMFKNDSAKNPIINVIWVSITKDSNYSEIIVEDIMPQNFKNWEAIKPQFQNTQ